MYKHKYFIYLFILTTFSFGQSLQDLKKMQAEYEKFKKQNTSDTRSLNIQNASNSISEDLPRGVNLSNSKINRMQSDSLYQNSKYFGYDFFSMRDSLPFWENLPIPRDYLLGPGDELIISIWGETQLRQKHTISKNGTIYDEKVGLLVLNGKNLKEAEEYLYKQFSRVYSTLNNSNPSSYIDISIGAPKSINVNFSGQVLLPGLHPIHAYSNIITGLIQSGGIDTTGSLREIKVRRNGTEFMSLDLYDFLLFGKMPKDIQLRDQDVVFIPVRLSTVSVDSAVMKPGIYESKFGETIKNMIDYAGGVSSNASSSISLQRITPIEKRIGSLHSIYENFYIDYEESKKSFVQDGDVITVRAVDKTSKQVEIIGLKSIPNIYHYYNGMKLKDLIDISDGFKDSSTWSAYVNSAELIRRDPKNRYETVITFDLFDVINNKYNIELANFDRLVVHKNLNFDERKNIKINGEVNMPGSYPLIKDGETLMSIINRSGGLTSKALKDGINIFRVKEYYKQEIISEIPDKPLVDPINNIDENSDKKYYKYLNEKLKKDKNRTRVAWNDFNISLMPGDSIIVKEITRTIFVDGEVNNPGLIEFRKGKSFQYYLDSAGGVNINGDKKNIVVIYANGSIKPKKRFLSPKINDGATIFVNKKELNQTLDLASISSFMTIISTAITSLILIQQLSAN